MKTQKEVVDPILNLFGAADGGAAFVIFYHQFLPQIYAEDKVLTDLELEFKKSLENVSNLCAHLLKAAQKS